MAGIARMACGILALAASSAATQPLATAPTPVASRVLGSKLPIPW